MRNVYEELEKLAKELGAMSSRVLEITMKVNSLLTEHDEYKNSFKVIQGGLTGVKNGALVEKPKEDNIFTLKDGKVRNNHGSVEIRFRKLGYNKSFTSKTLAGAQAKFKAFLKELNATYKNGAIKKAPTLTVGEWAITYLEKFKSVTLCEKAVYHITGICKRYVVKELGDKELKTLTALELQDFFNKIVGAGKTRTAEDLKTFLTGMLDKALALNYVTRNVMHAVVVPKHYRKHGTSLSQEEERAFVQSVKGDHYELVLLFCLYSGARISEALRFNVNDVDFKRNVLLIHTTKQKDRVNAKPREVPIFPKLKPVLERALALGEQQPFKLMANKAGQRFKSYCPEHHLHELRHTFTTRCRESGISEDLTSLWTGHVVHGSTTATVYTHFSYEFQQKQALLLV